MDSTSLIWEKLKKRFQQPDKSRIAQLQQILNNIVQGELTIDEYFNDLNIVWEELKNYRHIPYCQCGGCNQECFQRFAVIEEEDYVYKFLNGLNEDYKILRSQVLMMKPFPSLDEAYNLALREESQKIVQKRQSFFVDPITMTSINDQRRRGKQ